MEVKKIQNTSEDTMVYIARVSNPENQSNPDIDRLINYCIKHQHWSVFEHSFMTLEINTSRAIGTQILRHRSFTFQEFSQRYSSVEHLDAIKVPELRRQDTTNRQNSIADLPIATKTAYEGAIKNYFSLGRELYLDMLHKGIAKESARMILPMATPTRLYMSGTCRSWIHYIQLRTTPGTQKEHRDIAKACKVQFCLSWPVTATALGWIKKETG